jgi:CAAX prenyl protease-like protein
VFFANRTTLFARSPASAPSSNPAADHLLPFVFLAAATFIAAIPSESENSLRPLRLIAVAFALWISRADRPGLEFSRSWHAPALGAGAFVLAKALERLAAMAPTAMALEVAIPPHGGATALWILDVVTLVVAIPIACELAFRGYLLRRVASRSFVTVDPRETGWIALLISACAYAAVSGAFWTTWPAGLLYGLAYRRRGRLGDAVLAHAIANALSTIASVSMAGPQS